MMQSKPRLCPKNPRRLTELRMTIALGILGQQCLVVATDTQETWGSDKYNQGKIVSAWRGNPHPSGAIWVSGAGAGDHIDAAGEEITNKFHSFSGTMDEFESWLRDFTHKFYSRHVMPFVGRVDVIPDFQLIVGARHAHTSRLWTTAQTVVTRKNPYAIVGISRGSSSSLLRQLYQPFPSLNVAAILAAYVVRQAKLSTDGVGLETEIRYIFREGMSFVKEETVQQWEFIFSRYSKWQREIIGYLSGFTELQIRLEGSIVRQTKNLAGMIDDLEKMREELSKYPVIQGLDDPSRRSTSEMSDLGL